MNIYWFNFHFQPNINVETTLGHRHWIDVILSMLFQCYFVNFETTSINIRRLNFQFQPNFNFETTLVHRRWINVILSTLLQRCFANGETMLTNVRRLNFHFQPNINVETTLMNVDNQRCFNVDVFAGIALLGATIAPNLMPWVLRKIFSLEMVKNGNCLESRSKQNALFSENVPLKNAPMPPMSRTGLDHFVFLYFSTARLPAFAQHNKRWQW